MRVLIAPDKFKHALSARDVTLAIARGVYATVPIAELDLCPLADGGEGSGQIIAAQSSATARVTQVHDALMRPCDATWWWQADDRLAIIELAEAAGLRRIDAPDRDPLKTTTFGVGELIRVAQEAGATRILLAVGGSATVDGGAGALQALGWRLLDDAGRALPLGAGGGALAAISRLAAPTDAGNPPSISILADVNAPLLGPNGAAVVYAPQKGASLDDVRTLEAGLSHWATLVSKHHALDAHRDPFLGAAGGFPTGLFAIGATMVAGFDAIAELVHLGDRLARADLVITAEGRLDLQTLQGKVVAGVARAAKKAGVPCIAIVGGIDPTVQATVERTLGLRCVAPLHSKSGDPTAADLARTAADLERVTAEMMTRQIAPRGC